MGFPVMIKLTGISLTGNHFQEKRNVVDRIPYSLEMTALCILMVCIK